MATYKKEMKEKLIKLMLPPENKSVKEFRGMEGRCE
jgi:hypothetical protein